MPINPDHFRSHPVTDDTGPRYAHIRAGEAALYQALAHVEACVDEPVELMRAEVDRATLAFAEVIDAQAPDSADKTAAIRCVRLARMAANEGVMSPRAVSGRLFAVARTEIQKARWQANSAIACGGK